MFMFLSTDAFSIPRYVTSTDRRAEQSTSQTYRQKAIRRPYRGIQIKEDTYSTISIRKPNGDPIFLLSSSSPSKTFARDGSNTGGVGEYADYILQRVEDQRNEKQQIIETFGDPFVYFFGERPRVVTFSGLLVSTEDFNWRSQFWENYNEKLRGTKLVQQNARAYISFDTIIIEGYPLAASAVDTAEEPYTIPFSLQMFVTDYYDWSDIGQMRFPGKYGFVDLDAMNKELDEARSKYISTSSRVRLKNLNATSSGILATLRKGAKAVNSIVSQVDGIVDQIHNVIGGRVVRVPIGAAGYYANAGDAVVGAGSIDSPITPTATLGKQFDAATGQYKGVTGSVKLRMPSYSKYATPWTSDVNQGSPIGFIFENWDEYVGGEEIMRSFKYPRDNLGRDKSQERQAQLVEATKEYDAQLALYNIQSPLGGVLGSLAETVAFAKSAFGMVMTAAAIADTVSDAVRTGTIDKALKSALGIQSLSAKTFFDSPLRTFENSFKQLVEGPSAEPVPVPADQLGGGIESKASLAGRKDALSAIGVTSVPTELSSTWLGSGTSYKKMSERTTASSVGDVYKQSTYSSPTADLNYEKAYGEIDYTNVSPESDEGFQKTLESVYGDLDEALVETGSSVRKAVEATYTSGKLSLARASPEARARILAMLQATPAPEPEDTRSIRGVEDVDAEIAAIL
jgi:hypothetical protein